MYRNRGQDRGVIGGVQRHGRGGDTAASASRTRVAGLVLLIAYLTVAGWLALRPLPVPWVAPPNLQPFATIRSDLAEGSLDALRGLARDVALLAPLGVLLPLASGRAERPLAVVCARTVCVGALVSSAMLLLQSGVPGHSVNVDSVLLNTAGVALSCLLVFPLVRAWLRRRSTGVPPWTGSVPGAAVPDALPLRDEAGGGAPPRTARVGIAP
ncbi:VanZ family protein [Streptomyces sp. WMMB 322]|uniref:VanZ family protein n=1 Tax=Streptomyces sp. WMMB 322 TaxID=1286821 RepID=UPI0020C751CE|nr:VanZ family protein [Streptomyces sp. WMMB 322]